MFHWMMRRKNVAKLTSANNPEGRGKKGLLRGADIPYKLPTFNDPQLFWQLGDWEISPGSFESSLAEIKLCYGTPSSHRILGSSRIMHNDEDMAQSNAKMIVGIRKTEIDNYEKAYRASRLSASTPGLSAKAQKRLERAQTIAGYLVEFFRRWGLITISWGFLWAVLTFTIPALAGGRMGAGFTLLYSIGFYAAATWLQMVFCTDPDVGFDLSRFHLYTGLAKLRAGMVGWWNTHKPGTSWFGRGKNTKKKA
jgi:hypothetical protein